MTKISTDPPAFRVRPAQPEEAGAFFAQTPEQNAQMGAIGCVRMDFGKRGTAFWHTWHPRGREELNSPEFRAELQQVVDTLRETVLKDLSSMRHFCYENGGKIPGGWSQNYGYVIETEHYEYCLRCNPMPGDYQAYLGCYDLNEQKIDHAYQPLIGRVYFINGDDPAQVAWMKRQTPPTLESKIILVQGSIPEMQKSLDSRVYFDQNGVLCQRLGIDQVPARVSAVPGDRFLKVEFIPAEEGRK